MDSRRTRKITVKGQMRGSCAQIRAGNLSSWVPLYRPLLVAWNNPHASHPRRKNDLANACTSRPINLVSATGQIHPLVSLGRVEMLMFGRGLLRNGAPVLGLISLRALCVEMEKQEKSGIQEKVMAFWVGRFSSNVVQPLAFMVLSQTGFCASTTLALRWFQ